MSTEEARGLEVFWKERIKLETGPLSVLLGRKEQITVVTRHFFCLSVLPGVPFSLTLPVLMCSRKTQAVLTSCVSRRQASSQEAGLWSGHVEECTLPHLTAQLCWLCRCERAARHCHTAKKQRSDLVLINMPFVCGSLQ